MPAIREKNHFLSIMMKTKPESCLTIVRAMRCFATLVLILLLCAAVTPDPPTPDDPTRPLPQDSGVLGLQEMLLRLHTTARLMQVVAHPDDEDGGLLTLESRGKGATVLLQTLNRGEGGQNKVGSNLFDVLGVLRTLELTAADRYYGVEQRFTRVADFGFSKTADETFQKWQGHDIPLADLVRVIRTFRPDVLVARFSGTERDGHGHHQASAILTQEAFHAAADPKQFPEQIAEGLQPWQVKKLYIGNVCGFGALTCPDDNYTVKLNTGEMSAGLGMTYQQFAVKGLRHQLSQGLGERAVDSGPHYAYYKRVEPSSANKTEHETDFFDGLDTSLPSLAFQIGWEAARIPFLRPALAEIAQKIDAATAGGQKDPAGAATPLLDALSETQRTIALVKQYRVSQGTKAEVLAILDTKEDQLERAANLALGAELKVVAEVPEGANAEDAFMAVPGTSFQVLATFSSKAQVAIKEIALDLPQGWTATKLSSGNASSASFRVTVPKDATYTRPYWHRDDPETDAINKIDDAQYVTLPFPPPPVRAHASYNLGAFEGAAHATATVSYKGTGGEGLERAIAVAPAFSVALEPGELVIPVAGGTDTTVKVAVTSNVAQAKGTLHLELPAGWRSEPASQPLAFQTHGQKLEAEFKLSPSNLQQGRTSLRAVFEAGGTAYSEGYSVVTRDDLNTFYYYQPATERISMVDVKVPTALKIAYVMGAGDDIPAVLQQLGLDVTLLPADKLATEKLDQYQTIVLGIRTYDTQKTVTESNKKLMDFVSSGGTLLVQYNASAADFNANHLTPYPAELSRARVSVEEAPVEILAPDDGVFHYPNQITAQDFDGWVQERGLYFMDQWDDRFKTLLSCHDPNEPDQKGGLLRAQYGKGTYIYTGYAFFRQLPAGVPGAIRLYVNLLAAGRQ